MTDLREETVIAGADLREPSNAGRELAAARDGPVAAARKKAQENMLADVDANRGEISQFLAPFGVDFDFFRSGLRVFLMRQMQTQPDFFTSVTAISFMEALFRIAMNGLIPDGKESAIAAYKGAATPLFMRDGFVKVLWRTGMVKSINDGTVTRQEDQEGRFEYVEGDEGFVRHRPSMDRKDADEIVAAYCVIQLVGGGAMREVVTKSDLEKIRKMSHSPARRDWASQMDRKAAIRRIMGKMPREKQVAQLLAHDEDGYDLAAVAIPAAPSGVRARLAPAGDVARPGFAPGHAEAQLNPLAPERLDEILDGDGVPPGASLAGDPRETAEDPARAPEAASGPENGPGVDPKLISAVAAYVGRLEGAKNTTKLESIRAANAKLLAALAEADPERAESVDATFNRFWQNLDAEAKSPPDDR